MRCIAVMLLLALASPTAAFAEEGRPTMPAQTRLTRAAARATPLRDALGRDTTAVRLQADARRQVEASRQVAAAPRERAGSWIRRHPACFGSLVGFVIGFAIGFLPGDDAVFDDFEASFNGLVIGGIGAAAGAIVGAVAGK